MTDAVTVLEGGSSHYPSQSPFLVFRLSWVAYMREFWALFVRLFILMVVAIALTFFFDGNLMKKNGTTWPSNLAVIIALVWTAYSVALTRSVRVYTDDSGVWMFSGVFPWQKGVTGVQWRDVGQAGYTQGFLSWALQSYSIGVTHRFTTGSELNIRHVHRGNLAVEHINGIMSRLQGRVMPS